MNTRTKPHIHEDRPPCTCDLTKPEDCPRHMDSGRPQTMKYVVGFLLHPDRKSVALIRKNKPKWQAGLLNGIGGKIEPGETALQAMEREFLEETSVKVNGWRRYASVGGRGFLIDFFVTTATIEQFNNLQSITDELLEVVPVNYIHTHNDFIQNLRWLLPLALDKDNVVAVVADNSLPGEG